MLDQVRRERRIGTNPRNACLIETFVYEWYLFTAALSMACILGLSLFGVRCHRVKLRGGACGKVESGVGDDSKDAADGGAIRSIQDRSRIQQPEPGNLFS